MQYNRIHIIGPAGSGKTELAARLSKLFGHPTLNLDCLAYTDAISGTFEQPRSRTERLASVENYSKLEYWIAEGAYFSWLGKSFKHAEIIVRLNPPSHIRAHNLRRRHSSFNNNEVNTRLSHLLEQNSSFDALFNQRISGFLQPFNDKLKTFTGPGKAYKFFARLNHK